MTTPALRVLSQEWPDAEIHFLTQVPSDQIFEYNPYVTEVILIPEKPGICGGLRLIWKLRKENYSASVDFFGLPKTALLSRLIGAKKRIGFNLRGRTPFYSHALDIPVGCSYSALQKSHLLSALGISSQETRLDFFIGEKQRKNAKSILETLGVQKNRPLVSISPVSRREYKVWPAGYFAQVADYLAERYDPQILFLWGPGEYHFVKEARDLMMTKINL